MLRDELHGKIIKHCHQIEEYVFLVFEDDTYFGWKAEQWDHEDPRLCEVDIPVSDRLLVQLELLDSNTFKMRERERRVTRQKQQALEDRENDIIRLWQLYHKYKTARPTIFPEAVVALVRTEELPCTITYKGTTFEVGTINIEDLLEENVDDSNQE